MLSYSAPQIAAAAATSKTFAWLLTIITRGAVTHRWSLVEITYDAVDYSAKVIAGTFSGISLSASESEYGVQAPNTLSFQASNAGSILDASDFIDASVKVELVVNDLIMGTWSFNVKRCNSESQKLLFECEDFVQQYLQGDYPNTNLVKDAFLSNDTADTQRCVPVPIGNPFVPLQSILSGGVRYYLLGPASKTYSISKVRSPRDMGYKHDWSSPGFTFTQSDATGLDGVSYRVFLALIAAGGAHGLFRNGDAFYPIPTLFTRTDTAQINGSETGAHTGADGAAGLTHAGATWVVDALIGSYVVNLTDGSYAKITDNAGTTVEGTLSGGADNDWDTGDLFVIGGPASLIRWILIDMGFQSADIDDVSFGATEVINAGQSLVWDGVFDVKIPRKTVLSALLLQCNSYITVREKICLFPYSKTSVKTITNADITKPQEIGPDSFRANLLERIDTDSGFIEWQPADEIQNMWQKVRVSSKFSSGAHTGADNASSLTDAGQDWPVDSLVGGTATNTATGATAPITANTATTVTGTLSSDDWDTGDTYVIDVSNNISDETITTHLVRDSQDAQRIGVLALKRKLLAKSQISFNSKATLLAMEPNDVVTISGDEYGGVFDALIKSMQIKEDISMSFTAKTYDK